MRPTLNPGLEGHHMSNLTKTPKEKDTPADMAQVTLLIDKSASMDVVEREARLAIDRTMKEFADRKGMVFSIRFFDSHVNTLADFGTDLKNTSVYYRADGGETYLYQSIMECIDLSEADARLTPEIKIHHVLVIITDGHDSKHMPDEITACKRKIKDFDVKATFIMLDFSGGKAVGDAIGLQGIPFSANPKEFKEAMDKVLKAIGQVADNIIKQLPPTTGLCLPPAR